MLLKSFFLFFFFNKKSVLSSLLEGQFLLLKDLLIVDWVEQVMVKHCHRAVTLVAWYESSRHNPLRH